MYQIQSKLCEVFECTEPELTSKGILDEFRAWHNDHPDIEVCALDPYADDTINSNIAAQFYEFYINKIGES